MFNIYCYSPHLIDGGSSEACLLTLCRSPNTDRTHGKRKKYCHLLKNEEKYRHLLTRS